MSFFLFGFAYFSRGTLPQKRIKVVRTTVYFSRVTQKRGEQGHLGDLVNESPGLAVAS